MWHDVVVDRVGEQLVDVGVHVLEVLHEDAALAGLGDEWDADRVADAVVHATSPVELVVAVDLGQADLLQPLGEDPQLVSVHLVGHQKALLAAIQRI